MPNDCCPTCCTPVLPDRTLCCEDCQQSFHGSCGFIVKNKVFCNRCRDKHVLEFIVNLPSSPVPMEDTPECYQAALDKYRELDEHAVMQIGVSGEYSVKLRCQYSALRKLEPELWLKGWIFVGNRVEG